MASEGASLVIVGGNVSPIPRRDALHYARSIGLTYLILHIATWSFLPTFIGNSINRDTIQIVYWGHELEFGYFKHPPFLSWLTEFVVTLFGSSDLALYASSELLMVISFPDYVLPSAPLSWYKSRTERWRRRVFRWLETRCNFRRGSAKRYSEPSAVVSDGLDCFTSVTKAGCSHQPIVTGSGRAAAQHSAFKWVNTVLGNVKSAITGTYRAIRPKHIPRYLAEYAYRFNRRYDLTTMIDRLLWVSLRTPPMPYHLLKMAEDYA